MKAISYLTIGVIAIFFGSVVVPIGTHANTHATVGNAQGLINLLAIGEIVKIQSSNSNGTYDIDLLDDESVRSFRESVEQLEEEIESAVAENNQSDADEASKRKRIEMIESGWYKLTSPWKVVRIGDDFVRLEPLTQLPRHEKVSWIAISQTSIRQIKSRK